ncbi:hypothetical protein ES703_00059 [subsurface metagenome]
MGFLKRKPKQDEAKGDIVEGFLRRPKEHRRTAIGWVDGKHIVLLLYQSTVTSKWTVLVSGLMSFEIESEEFKKKEEADNYFDELVKKHELSEY